MNLFDTAQRVITKVAAVSAIIGGCGLVFATAVTCVSIVGRVVRRLLEGVFVEYPTGAPWGLIRPILGEEELVAFAVGFAIFAALPWVTLNKGHIRVDLFKDYFGRRLNLVLDLVSDVALAVIAYLILTRQWSLIFAKPRRAEQSMVSEIMDGNLAVFGERLRDNQESQVLGISLWPTYIVAEVSILLFLLTTLFCIWRSARALVSNPNTRNA